MQNNDSRLIKAAKRTIRAEVTLIIVIIVIASWSVYALYKLAFGGTETVFGLSLTKLASPDSSSSSSSSSNNNAHQSSPQRSQEQKVLANYSSQQLKSATGPLQQSISNRSPFPIYLASNAAPPTPAQRSDQLNSIQSLIAAQNQHLLSRGLHPPLQPLAFSNQPRAALITGQSSPYDSNLIQNFNLNRQTNNVVPFPNQPLNARLINPGIPAAPVAANNLYGSSHVPVLSPIEAPRDRELDYESDDYSPLKTTTSNPVDYSNDRQADESNRDSGESVIDGGSPSGEDQEQESDSSAAPEAQNDESSPSNNEVSADESLPETTTPSPPEAPATDSQIIDKPDAGAQGQEEVEPEEAGKSSGGSEHPEAVEAEEASPEEEENARAAGLSIDEEVDRMTQPSLGSVSQQDKPINYNRNMVQFDDLPNPTATPSRPTKRRPSQRPHKDEGGSLIAHFADPQKVHAPELAKQRPRSSGKEKRENDLQVDHDIVRVGSAQPPGLLELIKKNRKRTKKHRDDGRESDVTPERAKRKSNERFLAVRKREKRQVASAAPHSIITAPYEIDGFLNSLDIDGFIERSHEKPMKKRQSRAMRGDGHTMPGSLEAAPSEPVKERIGLSAMKAGTKSKGKKRTRQVGKSGLMRRSDDEDDEEEEDGGGQEGEGAGAEPEGEQQEEDGASDSRPARSHRSGFDPRYHYITSNDTTLQDLLTRQHLLDALKNSQPPSPILGGHQQQQRPNLTGAANVTSSLAEQAVAAGVAPQGVDHQQAAGSLYSVDHGLLLYPASNDDYESKSMSKKKKKQEKKKEKKKMTVAMKKGGHNKKKHKKEEKKFIKEKKFKGAKKGKKVSKGKGGQGGKKGKKLYKDKGFKKKGFKNVYHKEEFGQKKSYFDEFRDKDFKKKWKKFDDKYNYAQMKKWQAKDIKGAKKMKDHGEKFKKYDKGKWKKKYHKHSNEKSESSKKHKKSDGF